MALLCLLGAGTRRPRTLLAEPWSDVIAFAVTEEGPSPDETNPHAEQQEARYKAADFKTLNDIFIAE